MHKKLRDLRYSGVTAQQQADCNSSSTGEQPEESVSYHLHIFRKGTEIILYKSRSAQLLYLEFTSYHHDLWIDKHVYSLTSQLNMFTVESVSPP